MSVINQLSPLEPISRKSRKIEAIDYLVRELGDEYWELVAGCVRVLFHGISYSRASRILDKLYYDHFDLFVSVAGADSCGLIGLAGSKPVVEYLVKECGEPLGLCASEKLFNVFGWEGAVRIIKEKGGYVDAELLAGEYRGSVRGYVVGRYIDDAVELIRAVGGFGELLFDGDRVRVVFTVDGVEYRVSGEIGRVVEKVRRLLSSSGSFGVLSPSGNVGVS